MKYGKVIIEKFRTQCRINDKSKGKRKRGQMRQRTKTGMGQHKDKMTEDL